MKQLFKKRHLLLLAIALLLSGVIVRTTTMYSVPACDGTPACETRTNTGTQTTKTRGYPLAVQQTKTFEPDDASRFAETSIETQGFSVPSLLINALFWFALLDLGWRAAALASKRK